jgi:hypothetical protein
MALSTEHYTLVFFGVLLRKMLFLDNAGAYTILIAISVGVISISRMDSQFDVLEIHSQIEFAKFLLRFSGFTPSICNELLQIVA